MFILSVYIEDSSSSSSSSSSLGCPRHVGQGLHRLRLIAPIASLRLVVAGPVLFLIHEGREGLRLALIGHLEGLLLAIPAPTPA